MADRWVEHWCAYDTGPVMSDHPWPIDWEQDPHVHDGHAHEWEHIIWGNTATRRENGSFTQVERLCRCRVCLAPRCGHTGDRPPCREVRHHVGPHNFGTHFEPVGGVQHG